MPLFDPLPFQFEIILSVLTLLLNMAMVVVYCGRRWRGWNKFNRLYLFLLDMFLWLFWACDLILLLARNTCASGTLYLLFYCFTNG